MPKGHRSVRSQGFYRVSPASTPASQYAAISSRPAIPSPFYTTTSVPLGMSQQGYSQGYIPNGGPVQHPLAPQYTSIHPAPPQQQTQPPPPPPSLRPSSGAWTPSDDQTLMTARAQGLNWAPIQHAYFPSKTPNACRKRHERLMERRSADDWDSLKLENLAKKYMAMRREIWAALAAQTGEKWNVVEQKCMSQGLKNLQTAARSGTRRERLLPLSASHANPRASYGPNTNFTDDSGYADELDLDLDLEPEPGYETPTPPIRRTAPQAYA
ncbi:myb family transcription factor [Diplocarpon rosae]|nr:myb family transcription factor [Diplocarpon rosae]